MIREKLKHLSFLRKRGSIFGFYSRFLGNSVLIRSGSPPSRGRRFRGVSLLLIAGLALMLGSCGPVKLASQYNYSISDMQSAKTASYRQAGSTILVSQPAANPGYDTASMIYMITPYELKSYSQSQWVAPPAQMLMTVMASSLRRTGFFAAVITPPFSGVTNYRLDTQLIKLQQEFLLPTSQEHLTMLATLISNNSNRVLATKQFDIVIPTQENNPYGGVLAANLAAAQLSAQLSNFVVGSIR